MFRELSRKSKQISHGECIELLKNETRGVLSVIGDGGYPYGMPMNHFYSEDDGNIYFHCGYSGHREDSLKKDSRVSFCVLEKGTRAEGEWALRVRSVIAFGKIDMIYDKDAVADIARKLCLKFTDDEDYIKKEIERYASKTVLLKLVPEHICGKLVMES